MAQFLTDPVEDGYVVSIARPGANITGTVSLPPALFRKQMQVLKEAFPQIRQVASLAPAGAITNTAQREFLAAARDLQIEVSMTSVQTPAEIDAALAAMSRDPPDALQVGYAGPIIARFAAILEFCKRHRVPSMWGESITVARGALMSYSTDRLESSVISARQLDRILRGTKPEGIAVEYASQFVLMLNLKTAADMGLSFPASILARATTVIR